MVQRTYGLETLLFPRLLVTERKKKHHVASSSPSANEGEELFSRVFLHLSRFAFGDAQEGEQR